jgi:hypothetical protein
MRGPDGSRSLLNVAFDCRISAGRDVEGSYIFLLANFPIFIEIFSSCKAATTGSALESKLVRVLAGHPGDIRAPIPKG